MKSPWFWLALVALLALILFVVFRPRRSTSIGAPAHLPPSAPPPSGGGFAADLNAISKFASTADSIFSDN